LFVEFVAWVETELVGFAVAEFVDLGCVAGCEVLANALGGILRSSNGFL